MLLTYVRDVGAVMNRPRAIDDRPYKLQSAAGYAILSANESEVFGMKKVLFLCHGRIPPNFEKSLCL